MTIYRGVIQRTGAAAFNPANFDLNSTVTPAGTTGARTINQPAGSVNFAAAAESLVVTNNLVTANSVILLTVASNDSSTDSVHLTQTTGSFTIYVDNPPDAELRVNFLVVN